MDTDLNVKFAAKESVLIHFIKHFLSVRLRSMVAWLWFSVGSYQRLQKWYLLLLLLWRSAIKSCAEDKEIVGGLYVSKNKINSILAL